MPALPLVLGLAAALAGGAAALYMAFRRERPAVPGGQPSPASSRGKGHDRAPLLTRVLSIASLDMALQQTLLAAGLLVRPSELVAVSLGVACFGFCGILLAGRSLLVGAGVAAVAASLPLLVVRTLAARRRTEFQNRLPDALDLTASALRSGYSFARALSLVAQEMKGTMGDEARRVMDELAVGLSLDEALTRLADRQPSYDVRLFTAAVQIQTRVGGNLAEILLKTASMVRQRGQLQSEIRALTAEGRLSASILAAIPIFLAIAVNALSPGYLDPLTHEQLGRVILGTGCGLWVLGLVAIKKLAQIEI
jgi:tight adherence protein B